jgi:ubiquinone/menaquinone biosynthesis C-methylase UbiE
MTQAPYDAIADWYEREFLAAQASGDPIGIRQALVTLLGPGHGRCLELGCGTGARAGDVRALGWTPLGVDVSTGMLRYTRGRLPVLHADATRLPVRDGAVDAVITVLAHTDMPDYPAVLREAARVLRDGGSLIHIGVHPAFCGGFADRSDPEAVVIRPGYLDGHWTTASWTSNGVRDKVGATHLPLPELLHAFLDAGLVLDRFIEGGGPVPVMFGVRAAKR